MGGPFRPPSPLRTRRGPTLRKPDPPQTRPDPLSVELLGGFSAENPPTTPHSTKVRGGSTFEPCRSEGGSTFGGVGPTSVVEGLLLHGYAGGADDAVLEAVAGLVDLRADRAFLWCRIAFGLLAFVVCEGLVLGWVEGVSFGAELFEA